MANPQHYMSRASKTQTKKKLKNLESQHLSTEIIEEKPIKRIIEVSYEDEGVIYDHKPHVENEILHVLFIPLKVALSSV